MKRIALALALLAGVAHADPASEGFRLIAHQAVEREAATLAELVKVTGERDALKTQVEKLTAERDALKPKEP